MKRLNLVVKVDEEEKAKLDNYAAQLSQTPSSVVRMLLGAFTEMMESNAGKGLVMPLKLKTIDDIIAEKRQTYRDRSGDAHTERKNHEPEKEPVH